ncbi:hypothetical protein H4R35_000805 [Dimargaris xerosporica]|nr:hypothetical protein H4R35_000805 [Dimargaris xerosporica]
MSISRKLGAPGAYQRWVLGQARARLNHFPPALGQRWTTKPTAATAQPSAEPQPYSGRLHAVLEKYRQEKAAGDTQLNQHPSSKWHEAIRQAKNFDVLWALAVRLMEDPSAPGLDAAVFRVLLQQLLHQAIGCEEPVAGPDGPTAGYKIPESVTTKIVSFCRVWPDLKRGRAVTPTPPPLFNEHDFNIVAYGCLQLGQLGAGWELCLEASKRSQPVSAKTLRNFLNAHRKASNLMGARQIHEYIQKHNVAFDVMGYNILVEIYAKHHDLERATEAFADIQRTGLPYDAYALAMLMRCSAELSEFQRMDQFHAQLKQSTMVPSPLATQHIIKAFTLSRRYEDAWAAYHQIQLNQWPVCVALFRCIIESCGLAQHAKHLREVEDHVVQAGLGTNHYVVAELMYAYSRMGNCSKLLHWYSLIHSNLPTQDLPPIAMMATALGNQDFLTQAQDLCDRVLTHAESCPVYMVSAMFDVLHRHDLPSQVMSLINATHKWPQEQLTPRLMAKFARAYADANRLDRVKQLTKAFCRQPHPWERYATHSLITAYARLNRLDEAIGLYEQMTCSGTWPTMKTFSVMTNACVVAGQPERALMFFYQAQKTGKVFPSSLMVDTIHLFATLNQPKEVATWYDAYWQRTTKPQPADMKRILTILNSLGNIPLLHDLFDRLHGHTLQLTCFAMLLRQCIDQNQLRMVPPLIHTMQQSDHVWTQRTYCAVMEYHSANRNLSELIKTWDQLRAAHPVKRLGYISIIKAFTDNNLLMDAFAILPQAAKHFLPEDTNAVYPNLVDLTLRKERLDLTMNLITQHMDRLGALPSVDILERVATQAYRQPHQKDYLEVLDTYIRLRVPQLQTQWEAIKAQHTKTATEGESQAATPIRA